MCLYETIDDKKIVKDCFNICESHIYGYFTKDDILYKIYQPKKPNRKFLNVKKYMQGQDQIENSSDVLIITSSLKDVMTLNSFNIKCDIIASNSENSILSQEEIDSFKEKYKYIITYMNSDEPGVKAMKKYKELYDIPGCYVSLEKDPSDIVKIHGRSKAMIEIIPKINKTLELCKINC